MRIFISVVLLAGMGACYGQESRGTILGRVTEGHGRRQMTFAVKLMF